MPTPDSSSTEAAGVYLIHDLGLERCFWALWPSQEAYQAFQAPQLYETCEGNFQATRLYLQARFPAAGEISLPADASRQLYRLIRRAELPEAVRIRIAAELVERRAQQQQLYLAAGFLAHELDDIKALKRRYRRLVRQHHPDSGGNAEKFKELQELYERACLRLRIRRI